MTHQEKNSNDFTAKKSLGQNFLHAPHIVGKMIHEAGIGVGAHVLEVGPGKGILTEGLLAAGALVTAVEKDDRAIGYLREKFAGEIGEGKFTLVHGDILDLVPEEHGLVCGEYIIAANIPYYITGEFLRKFLESSCQPKRMVIMLQKEVAKRITGSAGEGSEAKKPKESILSISVKAYGKPKYLTTVPARHFRPVPKVDSALLLIDNISKEFFKAEKTIHDDFSAQNIDTSASGTGFESAFFAVVKAGFAHKRKVLIKNLENSTAPVLETANKEILQEIWLKKGFSEKIRAEELSVDDWKDLAEALAESFAARTAPTLSHQQ